MSLSDLIRGDRNREARKRRSPLADESRYSIAILLDYELATLRSVADTWPLVDASRAAAIRTALRRVTAVVEAIVP